jgi:preprotein translocase subunit SecD
VRRSRGLWVSIAVVAILVVASAAGFAMGELRPLLGLDLQGGVSVILSAPDGTPSDVMDRTRENISNRVDAFGVGEPDIVVSGNTIDVQIPGASRSTIEQRPTTQFCLVGPDDVNYGCAGDETTAKDALDELRVISVPTEACLTTGDTRLGCYPGVAQARAAKASIAVTPKASASPSGSASAEPTVGPGTPPEQWCLTDSSGKELECFDSKREADAATAAVAVGVTEKSWCVTGQPKPEIEPPPSATPTPSATPSSDGPKDKQSGSASPSAPGSETASATASPGGSPSPSASPSPAFPTLDTTSASDLPCVLNSKEEADEAVAAIDVSPITTQFCVVSSAGEDLGCFISQADAAEREKETGQERLLEVIGETARLEERVTQAIISPGAPAYETTQVTCPTVEERATPKCSFAALEDQPVVYTDAQGNKLQLGPVVLSGSNIRRSTATLEGGTATSPVTQWGVNFELDGPGSDSFAAATTAAVSAPPPQNQIAIVVDRVVISNPVVNDPITTGSGIITGSFSEQEAKDLATQLNAGALPVELTRQSVRTVSPTLGEASLKEGIVAGIAGLVLLFLYLLFYYRLLGVVAWFGMSIWAMLAVALVSIAGDSFGYALSLAGVAGLVISLGVTADSYIVFFERLKDEVRSGRSPRAAVQPAFQRSFRTIVAADIVTGIAAAVLYVTAVSSVRGFALTLGVATLLDLFVVYFFKRPTVFLIARNKRLVEMPGFGLTSGVAGEAQPGELPGGQTAREARRSTGGSARGSAGGPS